MDDVTLLALAGAATIGLVAALSLLRHAEAGQAAQTAQPEGPSFAVATEGMKRCPGCGLGNLVGDRTCAACGKRLPG